MHAPRFIQLHQIDSVQLAEEAISGLRAQPASLSPKFFYDALGSRLFDAITELPEYYPTRTEAAIFAADSDAIAQQVRRCLAPGFALIDLGAGNCAKAARLFDSLQPGSYLPVDISVDFLRASVLGLQRQYAHLRMVGIGLDFSARLVLPDGLNERPALVFYPGSSIGNFDPVAALRLLREAHLLARGGALLIGVDLVKPHALLQAAYDDSLGVTAAFNLNLLSHLNRLAGCDFRPRDWAHVALFNEAHSRIEMYLQARQALTVRWPGGERRFEAGERMHTENSYKWTPMAFETLLRQAGFRDVQCWQDGQGWFGVFLAQG